MLQAVETASRVPRFQELDLPLKLAHRRTRAEPHPARGTNVELHPDGRVRLGLKGKAPWADGDLQVLEADQARGMQPSTSWPDLQPTE
jgi:hypothetical protein